MLGLAKPDSKHFKKKSGSGCLTRPTDLESRWAAGPKILGSGSATTPNDIIICILNILNFIIFNIKILKSIKKY